MFMLWAEQLVGMPITNYFRRLIRGKNLLELKTQANLNGNANNCLRAAFSSHWLCNFFLVSKFFPQWTLFFLWDWSNPEVNNAFWNLWEGLGTYCIPPAYSRNSTYMMVESRVKISTFKRLPFHRIELANKAKLLWRRFFSPVPIFESSLYFEFFF